MSKPVHALVGTDLFLQLNALADVLRSAPPDIQRIDFEGGSAQIGDVLDELRSFAMFSSSKIVIVRDADDFISRYRESLEEYVGNPVADSILVLRVSSLPSSQRIHKAIAKSGQIHDCNLPKDLSSWIVNRAKSAHQLVIRPDAARVLLDLIGNDLGRLDNELAKLALQTDGAVDPQSIQRSVAFQREQEMWRMTDALGSGNIAEAMRRWRHLVQLDPSSEFRAITWLVIWLEKVRKALAMRKAGVNDFTIAKDLRIWPADAQKPFFRTIATLGESGAAHLVDWLAEIDHRSKSGLGGMAENVERFIATVGGIIQSPAPR